MKQTLAQLQAGQWAKATHIKLSEDIQTFPQELFELTETLEVLDLSNNQLHELPNDFSRFQKLHTLFLSNNVFEVFPSVLAELPLLSMIAFKACRIQHIPDHAFPKPLRWLILTNNQIESIPSSLGDCSQLQKLMLAGNRLRDLPQSMQHCSKLELLRISANQFTTLPTWLWTLPRLSWLAFAGNPCSQHTSEQTLVHIHWDDLQQGHVLGEGASGLISHAIWRKNKQEDNAVAFKAFKGEVTSDGFPADEMTAAISIASHPHLIEVLGKLTGHPEQTSGLIFSLIGDDYQNLAKPPSLASCTRDIYAEGQTFTLKEVLGISLAIASAANHLHTQGWTHGDLYAHNILCNDDAHCLLGDFGAASPYLSQSTTEAQAIERLEVRAFACLLEEILSRLDAEHRMASTTQVQRLEQLQKDCCHANIKQRPLFNQIHRTIQNMQTTV
ncbi:MAG: serine/threonine-protein kinase [Zetaproteobacteria bacterium]|nr:serine/threonine-protein kinase [Zetaproteobacteria bacterium]